MMSMRRTLTSRFVSDGRRAQVYCGITGRTSFHRFDSSLDLEDADCSGSITIHNASWDYEGSQPRHGTRVTALAEAPYFEQDAPSRREALGLAVDD